MISLSSSDAMDDNDDDDEDEVVETNDDDVEEDVEGKFMWAALAAATWTSRAAKDAGRGSEDASSGKLRIAVFPFMLKAATSCALAAISGVGNVPSHIRDFFRGSRISDTHFPQFRMRTPRYTGCLFESRFRFSVFDLSALICGDDCDGDSDGDENEAELDSATSLLWVETLIIKGFKMWSRYNYNCSE